MKLDQLQNKKILIVGFGTEGKSTFAFLRHFFSHQEIGIADKKNGNEIVWSK